MPFKVAEDGNNDIEAIKPCLEGDALLHIEDRTYHIDHHPEEPLLDVLAGQSPETHKREGVGEGIEHGHGRVGPGNEHIVGKSPRHQEEYYDGQIHSHGGMGDTEGSPFFRGAKLPSYIAIDSCQGIIDRHTRIAIEAVVVVEIHIEHRHDDAYYPKADMCLVLQPDINQAEDGGEYVKPIEFHIVQNLNITFAKALMPAWAA